ncbi:5919_t:CDS:2 [Scutellospora calospora]|uniref:5919_t:CDS:1 n=1 Tax=Scutellospora calospora TaxID=85575 RepID=A0ACA9KFC4_9GLOM|nr:5919_t:CDS:2 [Scutellospora calospora]
MRLKWHLVEPTLLIRQVDSNLEINEEKQSISKENIETDLTSLKEIKTETKTTEEEELKLINKSISKSEDSNNSDLLETELTTQILIEKNTERLLALEKRVEFINILVILYQKITSRRRQQLTFYTQYVEYNNTYFIYTHPTLGSYFTIGKLKLREAIYLTNFCEYQLVANNLLDLLTLCNVKPSILEKLINNTKHLEVWKMKGQKRIYMSFAQSTLRNKRAALRKAASGSNKITDWISYDLSDSGTKNSINNIHNVENENEYNDILFYDSSNNEDGKFTLESLDIMLKNNSDDIRLRIGFSKITASEIPSQSVNRGPWHARLICS